MNNILLLLPDDTYGILTRFYIDTEKYQARKYGVPPERSEGGAKYLRKFYRVRKKDIVEGKEITIIGNIQMSIMSNNQYGERV